MVLDPSNGSNLEQLALKGLMSYHDIMPAHWGVWLTGNALISINKPTLKHVY